MALFKTHVKGKTVLENYRINMFKHLTFFNKQVLYVLYKNVIEETNTKTH